jgi:hypothetical protein
MGADVERQKNSRFLQIYEFFRCLYIGKRKMKQEKIMKSHAFYDKNNRENLSLNVCKKITEKNIDLLIYLCKDMHVFNLKKGTQMNRKDIKELQENCAKLSDKQIHMVLGYSVEGLQAFEVLKEKGIQLGATDTREAFDETAIRALYVAQEYAKRNGKDFKKVNDMIGQIQIKDADNRYRPEYASIESSMLDVMKTVMEAETIANEGTVLGSASCRGTAYQCGNIIIRPHSAEMAADILRDPVAKQKEEDRRFAESQALVAKMTKNR